MRIFTEQRSAPAYSSSRAISPAGMIAATKDHGQRIALEVRAAAGRWQLPW